MRRYASPLLLFVAHAAMVTAVTAVLVSLASASPKPHASTHPRTEPVAAPPTVSAATAPEALPRPERHERSPLSDGTRLQRSERVSNDALEPVAATVANVPPPDDRAPAAAEVPAVAGQAPVDDQVAALQRLAALSQQEADQLGLIDDQLLAQRQQAADDESRRQREVEGRAASHTATVAALGTLRQAESLLVSGSSDGVDDELAGAEAALSGRTRLDVAVARNALERGDLFEAGLYVAAALSERRGRR
jgi:hypothetical protein